jgi:hypothetical protein
VVLSSGLGTNVPDVPLEPELPMSWLRRLERHFQPLAIPNLTVWLIGGQLIVFFLSFAEPAIYDAMLLAPKKVVEGEWWRLLAFPFIPTFGGILWLFALMFFYTMGSALEMTWGTTRYNLFVLIGYLSSIAFAALVGVFAPEDVVATNAFLYGSIFLAFAYLFPEYELLVFFIIPVKVKWLALLQLFGYLTTIGLGAATFWQGGWLLWVMLFASHLNISLFLGRDIADTLRRRGSRVLRRIEHQQQREGARHTCIACGATDLTHPDRDFRYCPQCQGTPAYCNLHLAGHEHLTMIKPVKDDAK